jgi:transposase
MTKRAKGKGVAAKAGLNRKILSRGFGMIAREIETALGGAVYSVSAAYTSQTCSRCGTVDAKQRQGKVYRCACGYVGDADVNAATNIARRAMVAAQQAKEKAAARAAAKGKAMPDRGRPRRRVAGTMSGGGLTPPVSGATALVASGEVLP